MNGRFKIVVIAIFFGISLFFTCCSSTVSRSDAMATKAPASSARSNFESAVIRYILPPGYNTDERTRFLSGIAREHWAGTSSVGLSLGYIRFEVPTQLVRGLILDLSKEGELLAGEIPEELKERRFGCGSGYVVRDGIKTDIGFWQPANFENCEWYSRRFENKGLRAFVVIKHCVLSATESLLFIRYEVG